MRKLPGLRLAALCGLLATSLASHAALVSPTTWTTTTNFDSTLTSASLIYDYNFYGDGTGRLLVVASGSSLQGPGVSGGPSQLYASDGTKDLVLSLRINSTTGALVSGTVNIPRDTNWNTGTNDSWTAAGTVTQFGWSDYAAATPTNNTFDLRWNVDSYDFTDVVANPGLVGGSNPCSSGASAGLCGFGYMRFSTTGIAFTSNTNGAAVNFGQDWVRGAGVISGTTPSSLLGTFDDGIAASAYANNPVTADVFINPVPLPAPLLMLGASLMAMSLPLARRRFGRA